MIVVIIHASCYALTLTQKRRFFGWGKGQLKPAIVHVL